MPIPILPRLLPLQTNHSIHYLKFGTKNQERYSKKDKETFHGDKKYFHSTEKFSFFSRSLFGQTKSKSSAAINGPKKKA